MELRHKERLNWNGSLNGQRTRKYQLVPPKVNNRWCSWCKQTISLPLFIIKQPGHGRTTDARTQNPRSWRQNRTPSLPELRGAIGGFLGVLQLRHQRVPSCRHERPFRSNQVRFFALARDQMRQTQPLGPSRGARDWLTRGWGGWGDTLCLKRPKATTLCTFAHGLRWINPTRPRLTWRGEFTTDN